MAREAGGVAGPSTMAREAGGGQGLVLWLVKRPRVRPVTPPVHKTVSTAHALRIACKYHRQLLGLTHYSL